MSTRRAQAFFAGWATLMTELVIIVVAIPLRGGTTPELGYLGTLLVFGLLMSAAYVVAFIVQASWQVLIARSAARGPVWLGLAAGVGLFVIAAVVVSHFVAGPAANRWHEVAVFLPPGVVAGMLLPRSSNPAQMPSDGHR